MQFKIADLFFSIDEKINPSKKYIKFTSQDSISNSDIRIKVTHNNLPEVKSKKLLFNAQKFWSIYNSKSNYILFDYFYSQNGNPLRVGIFRKNYAKGEVFIQTKKFSKENLAVINPLSYPIGSVLMSNLLARGKGVFIHAAGIKVSDGEGYLFCGKSDSGKSTIAELWRDYDGATILNDDRVIIRKKNNKFYLYGCPWHTESKFISNQSVVVDKIFFVFHGKKNIIKKLDNKLASLNLLKNIYLPVWDKKGINFSLRFLEDMAENIECFDLKFIPDKTVIKTINKTF